VTHEKVDLGKLLFFDPRLSASEIISCNTCHNSPPAASTLARPRSAMAAEGSAPRADVYNAVFQCRAILGRRAADLKAQAKGPVQASVEMNATPITSSRRFRRCRIMSPCSRRRSPTRPRQ